MAKHGDGAKRRNGATLRDRRRDTLVAAICIAALLMILSGPLSSRQNGIRDHLVNSGFEAASVTAGWEVSVYGATPTLQRDTTVVHEGRSALRAQASLPSDTAMGQEVQLKPGGAYRLRGWVRTRGLNPMGAPVYGTLQVQRPGGKGVLASGQNHGGETDWTQVSVPFTAPSDGRVRVCVFFVGFGKGTGTAWFDGLELMEIDLSAIPIAVTHEPLRAASISPYQYGQFIEYLCDLVPSMWAEKLYDGSFEGLTPYRFAYLRETDFKEIPWVPWGATNRADYACDTTVKVSGSRSQRIMVPSGPPCTVGVSQGGVCVERGKVCRFSCWLRQESVVGPVHVELRHAGELLAGADFHATGEWRKVTVRLASARTAVGATMLMSFRGPGTLWIDNASLMPEDNVGGWRRDVVEALRALKPGIIRFGGSTLDDANLGDFHWYDTVGDPDHRTPFRAWGGLQPTGPGLEEIVRLCQAVGAEPLICVRFTGSTPQEAADEVEYFNGAPDTRMGSKRARNGHRDPYHIRFWQVGNERGGPEYEAGLPAFCIAMRKADPSIRLLSSFPTEAVLQRAGNLIDYVCPHQYSCADLPGTEAELNSVRQLIEAAAPGRNVRVGVTEWNTTAGDWGPRRAMLWTLENALYCSRYQNLLHRHCDLVEIANRSNLTNSFCSGIIQTDRHRLYKTPTYYAQQLYATLAGQHPLKLTSELGPKVGPDISATLSADGQTLTLFAVNVSSAEISRPLDLTAFPQREPAADIWTLADQRHAGEPDATNSFDDPERIHPVHSRFAGGPGTFVYRFPPYSLTVMQWKVGHGRE